MKCIVSMNMQLRGTICDDVEHERRDGTQQCQVKIHTYDGGHPENSIQLLTRNRIEADELKKAVEAIHGR